MKKLVLAWLALTSMPGIATEGRTESIEFQSHGVTLSGSVVMPRVPIRAAVVFVHGSGKQDRSIYWAERFARDGIAALVYDKRGAGKSGGLYEGDQSVSGKNLELLADDAAAAVARLAAHPAIQGRPIGIAGISQAGWIAPLAAIKSAPVKFLVLWSAPVCKVSQEDIYSKFTSDRDGETAPTFKQALRARKQDYIWPEFLGRDTDSAEDLAKLSIPGLWIFSDNDSSIPVDLSISKLQELRARGHSYEYVLLSGHGHNNMEQTFSVAVDWILRQSL